jgi:hypothetical protein
MDIVIKDELLNNQLQELGANPNIQGKAVVGENYEYVRANFKAKNIQKYKTTTVKVVDVDFEHAMANIYKNMQAPKLAIDSPVEDNSNLVAISDDNRNIYRPVEELQIILNQESSNNPITLMDDWDKKMLEFSRAGSSMKGEISISKGKYIHKKSGYNYNFEPIKANLNLILDHAKLDQALTLEVANVHYNEIYKKFSILSSNAITEQNQIKPNLNSLLLSRTYSTDHTQTTNIISNIVAKINHTPYNSDLLAFISLGMAQGAEYPFASSLTHVSSIFNPNNPLGSFINITDNFINNKDQGTTIVVKRQDPLTIIHAINDNELKNYTFFDNNPDIGGFYKPEFNIIVFKDERTFIHEAAHAVINLIFNNDAAPYFDNKGKIYTQYHEAARKTLFKIYEKLGKNIDDQNIDLGLIKYYLKRDTSLELFAYAAKRSEIDDEKKEYLAKKYFPDQEITDFKTSLDNLTKSKINELQLSDDDISVIIEIGTILYFYPSDEQTFDAELIVRLPQLAFEGVKAETLHHYFAEIEQFWNENIHSKVNHMVEVHNAQCNSFEQTLLGAHNPTNFEYCLENFI